MFEVYDSIGKNYDDSRKADPEILRDVAAMLDIKNDKRYLDVGCGTGNYTVALHNIGGDWTGLDPAATMLDQAHKKTNAIYWLHSKIENNPLPDQAFHGVLCNLCLHHLVSIETAMLQIARLLSPQGKLVIFTATPRQMQNYWLWHYFPNMMKKSCAVMPSLNDIDECLEFAGFRIAKIKPFFVTADLQDLFLYSGKCRPQLYLSEEMRCGISSFQQHVTSQELKQGLKRLERDILSGEIANIVRRYPADGGDYMTIQAEFESVY